MGWIKENDRLDSQQTVLGPAEADRVYSGLPCHVRRTAPERDERIGKAGAVEMDRQIKTARDFGDRLDLLEIAYRAALGHLRDRDRPALGAVNATALLGLDRLFQGCGVDDAGVMIDEGELCAAREEFRRVAFVLVYMGHRGTEDCLPGLRKRREDQGVRRRSCRDEVDCRIRSLEDFTDFLTHPRHGRVGAVGHRVAIIRTAQCFEYHEGGPGRCCQTRNSWGNLSSLGVSGPSRSMHGNGGRWRRARFCR